GSGWGDGGDAPCGGGRAAEPDAAPAAQVAYGAKPEPMKQWPGVAATAEELAADEAAPRPTMHVKGKDLLLLPELIGMRIPDRWTFVIETAEPNPYLISSIPSRAGRPSPREAVSPWPRRWTEPAHLITSGPMTLQAWN